MHSPEVYNARWLRNNMTETERRVWSRLRSKQLGGYKFRRQAPVGPYVVDFMCISDRLAIEVDGAGHEDEEADELKTRYLQATGYRVLRIPASVIDESMDDVIHGIYLELTQPLLATDHPHPAGPLRGPADLPAKRGGEIPPTN
jgi:very-short-patch-repair endonuclease